MENTNKQVKLTKNQELVVEIEDLGSEGEGIGKVDGYPLFIKDALVGDVVRVSVMKAKKNYAYARSKSNLTYYRDSNAKEIDVFVEENNTVHPLEIKKSANPDKREVKKYSVLDKAELDRGSGGIVCMCEEPIPIDDKNCFIPSNLI